jgi:CMP-N,N'-diacetyllegionaminic acid synthase
MKILGLIPARGGSKGVPRKNIKLLGGKPMLWYTVSAAKGARGLDRIVLSTDDLEIADVGKRCGVDVPFIRPAELGKDDTPTLPVIQHALNWLEKRGAVYEAVCLLQPTSPFRGSRVIEKCLETFVETNADTLITLQPIPEKFHPAFVYFKSSEGWLHSCLGNDLAVVRRQDVKPAYVREGSVYIIRRETLMESSSLYGQRIVGYDMAVEQTVNVDTLEDWHYAERLWREKQRAGTP